MSTWWTPKSGESNTQRKTKIIFDAVHHYNLKLKVSLIKNRHQLLSQRYAPCMEVLVFCVKMKSVECRRFV